jgi:hypothetical protein
MVMRHQDLTRSQTQDDRGRFALGSIPLPPASSGSSVSDSSIQVWVTHVGVNQQIHYSLSIRKRNFEQIYQSRTIKNCIFFTALLFIGILTRNSIHWWSRIERIGVFFYRIFTELFSLCVQKSCAHDTIYRKRE